MAGRPWSREETLAALNLYCRTPFGRLHHRNPEIISFAGAIGRTASSVAMKCCNLATFDPALRARGIRGLSKASQLDEEVWTGFDRDPEAVGYESEIAFAKLVRQQPRASEEVQWEDVQGLDRQAVTKVRVNQNLFRSMILSGYRHECAVCQLSISALLVASHVVPWSLDKAERMNPRNGICLCALHDRAFDTGMLLIRPDYRVALALPSSATATNSAVKAFLINFENCTISLPDRWHPDPKLLERHATRRSAAI
jgi:putative restriction endonuclease